MFNDVITLFNKFIDKENDTCVWHANVIKDVELQKNKTLSVGKGGNQSADKVRLHIPYKDDFMIGDLQYRKPKEWFSKEKTNSITLNLGDFFVEGELEGGEYMDGQFSRGLFAHLSSNYDDVYSITSVEEYKTIPHFEVGGS